MITLFFKFLFFLREDVLEVKRYKVSKDDSDSDPIIETQTFEKTLDGFEKAIEYFESLIMQTEKEQNKSDETKENENNAQPIGLIKILKKCP